MTDDQDLSRAERFRTAVTVATHALAGTPELEVQFAAGGSGQAGDKARLPQVSREPTPAEVAHARGAGDMVGLRLRHHSDSVHAHYRPTGTAAAAIFDALEAARVECLGSQQMPGVGTNLDASLVEELRGARPDTAQAAAATALATRLALRRISSGDQLPAEVEAIQELCPDVSAAAFPELFGALAHQAEFARLARTAIADLGFGADLGPDPDQQDEVNDPDTADESEQAEANATEEPPLTEQLPEEVGDPDPELTDQTLATSTTERDAETMEEAEDEGAPPTPPRTAAGDSDAEYQVYCRDFDEVVDASELTDAAELQRHRDTLDRQLEPLRGAIGRLANRLQRLLLAQQARQWLFDLEEGILNTGRLSRVVTNPLAPLSFKIESESEFRDTVVSLLLDNSGSMRGRPITTAAICADVLSRTLERCGVRVEILGFTTRSWKGGQARDLWIKHNRPPAPGRLNDLRHVIYKPADMPWRRARRNLGLMLREGFLKENIDGEALDWASGRLVGRPEQRKILVVISDGAPIDDTTLAVNGPSYLERHLRKVIDRIEREALIELVAVGIGHDVTRYYNRAVTINSSDQLAGAITNQLAQLFELPAPRPGATGSRQRRRPSSEAASRAAADG